MLIGRAVRNSVEYRSLESVEDFFKDSDSGGDIASISKYKSERLSAVAAAHRIYTNSLAVLPFMIRQKNGDDINEISHPISSVIKFRANEFMTAYAARKAIYSQAFWHGIGYAYIGRKGGIITEIIPLPTDGHQRYVDANTGAVWHSFYADSDNPYKQKLTRRFQESELLIHRFESYDGISGRGILDLAKETIDTDDNAQKYNRKFYQNGARISGIIEVPEETNSDSRDIIRDDFERMTRGMDNAFRVAVMDLGLKYTPIGLSQKDSQYIENRGFNVEEMSRFTGIPAYMMQTGKQSYNSNEQQQLDFVTNTLMAPVTQTEQEWTYKLLSDADIANGMYLKLNVAALLRGDNKTRAEYYEKMIGLGIYNQDTCCALEDKSPLPDGKGKNYWMSKNYDTIDNIVSGGANDGI